MRATLWGVRGSVPVPGPATERFGGNTSCVQVSVGESEFVLDAGTGIRELGAALAGRCRRLHVLLTHLHLDHIQGLMFFAPFFDPEVEITVWGPPAAGRELRKRLARYISNPLSPIEIGELPAQVTFRDVPQEPWRIDGVEVRAALVSHRGPTLGYRLSQDGTSLCYLPDHEPALGSDLARAPGGWISGLGLARGAALLIHDCQYTEDEYPAHRGWGHSSLPDALAFARRSHAQRLLLVHHDPWHDDAFLEALGREASDRWAHGGNAGRVELGREGDVLDLAGAVPSPDMPAVVVDNPSESRFELRLDDQLIGRAEYRPAGDSVIVAHTEVDAGHEGEGLGSLLVREALEGIRASGKTVIPTCPFTAAYIRRHPEFVDLVEASLRSQFSA